MPSLPYDGWNCFLYSYTKDSLPHGGNRNFLFPHQLLWCTALLIAIPKAHSDLIDFLGMYPMRISLMFLLICFFLNDSSNKIQHFKHFKDFIIYIELKYEILWWFRVLLGFYICILKKRHWISISCNGIFLEMQIISK